MKRFVAMARVSSTEQAREGSSLESQEQALNDYAVRQEGAIVRFWRVTETASKRDCRKTFREIIAYVKQNARQLDGMLFYRIDRAARNMHDFLLLEQIEIDYGVPFISVTEPMQNNAAGAFHRRIMQSTAEFFAKNLSETVTRGLAQRVLNHGWFVGHAPYGYLNVRVNHRRVIAAHPEHSAIVRRMFHLYAYEGHTIESLIQKLHEEGVRYLPSRAKFSTSKVGWILRDRSYIGEVSYRGQWYPGSHDPLIDKGTWDRVQAILGSKVHRSHELTYASCRVRCGFCDHYITGELKTKQTKAGPCDYAYYRCTHYRTAPDHPKVRLTEAELDRQTLLLFERMRFNDPDVRSWFEQVLRERTQQEQQASKDKAAELNRQISRLADQQDRLLEILVAGTIDQETFTKKAQQIRDQHRTLEGALDVCTRDRQENVEIVAKAFELSQHLRGQWVAADCGAKRRILDILLLNCRLVGATLEWEMRKPFDLLVEGPLLQDSGGAGN